MIRKLVLPIAAAALLAGCVTTSPYGYRGGDRGDYYYGQPSVEYRYHGVHPGFGYGHPYYGPYRPGFSVWGRYGHPYYGRYYGGYYGHPYFGNPYYPPIYRPVPRPRPGDGEGRVDTRPDGGPWRNIDDIRRAHTRDPGIGGLVPARPSRPQPVIESRPRSGGSMMGEVIRRRTEDRLPSTQDE